MSHIQVLRSARTKVYERSIRPKKKHRENQTNCWATFPFHHSTPTLQPTLSHRSINLVQITRAQNKGNVDKFPRVFLLLLLLLVPNQTFHLRWLKLEEWEVPCRAEMEEMEERMKFEVNLRIQFPPSPLRFSHSPPPPPPLYLPSSPTIP